VQSVEVHPLANGAVRIWTRLNNLTGHKERIQVGCSFCTQENPQCTTPRFYEIDSPSDYVDIFFVSPRENINSYTFLIRSGTGGT